MLRITSLYEQVIDDSTGKFQELYKATNEFNKKLFHLSSSVVVEILKEVCRKKIK